MATEKLIAAVPVSVGIRDAFAVWLSGCGRCPIIANFFLQAFILQHGRGHGHWLL